MSFDWQTEEESTWEVDPPPPPRGRGRGLAVWMLLALLLILGGTTAYRAIRERVETVSATIREDVLGSHRLLQGAVASGDAEIFDDLLSGRWTDWTVAQQQLFRRGGLADRAGLGLAAASDSGEVRDVVLSPDLEEAEVIVARSFVITNTTGLSQTVLLDQVEVYRRGETRWLLAPPTGEPWTVWNNLSGQRLDLTYVTRDQAIAERLLQDLDGDIARLCASGMACPGGLRVRLQLDPDPATLLHSAPLGAFLTRRDPLIAPAPSLAGLPQEEQGYQALRRAYAARVVATAIARSLDYACCDRAIMLEALLAAHLHQLDLAPPPTSAADYHQVLREGTGVEDLYRTAAANWFRQRTPAPSEEAAWQARLLVDFLLTRRPDLGPEDLYRGLLTAANFEIWAQGFVDGLGRPEALPELQAAWLDDLVRKAGVSTDAGGGLLDDALLALCLPSDAPEPPNEARPAAPAFPHALFAYQSRSRSFARVSDEIYTSLMPLPAGSGPLLLRLDSLAGDAGGPSPQQSLVHWRDGVSERVFTLAPGTATSVRSVAPDGRAMTLDSFPIAAGRPNRTLLLDLDSCAGGACMPSELPAARSAHWSPDGQRLLLLDNNSAVHLVTRDGDSRVISAPGENVYAANWEDEQRVLLYQHPLSPQSSHSLVRLSLVDGQRERLVREEALRELLDVGPGDRVEVLFLARMAPPDSRVLLVAQTRPAERYNLSFIWLDLESRELARWMRAERTLFDTRAALHQPREGGALAVMLSRFDAPFGELLWSELQAEGSTQRYPIKNWFTAGAYAWSADGEWLAVARGHYIYLVAPRLGEERVLVHGLPNCSRVAWTGVR